MVIELRSEEHEPVAQLLKGLLDSGHLQQFAAYMENEHCPYHCMCFFEEDLLNFESKNRWCGSTEGWSFCLGHAADDRLDYVPEYTGYQMMKPWLQYEYGDKMAVVTIEEGYGLTVWDRYEFEIRRLATLCVGAEFSEESGTVLNQGYRTFVGLEKAWDA